MQSANYVPGVAGWKIHEGLRLELNDGNRRIYAEVKIVTTAGPGQTNEQAAQSIRETADSVAVERLTTQVTRQNDNLPTADASGYITGEKPARQAAEDLRRQEAADIAAAQLVSGLSGYEGNLAEMVRRVIREELKPGGMLHRD
ncbi:hypothetical protein SAMN02745900_04452 [Pseudomonas sp. URIL14HWK12:I8]|uniref:hypothetical protein n=1 Tax=unclassified Pseudomonas TaxID=196821 RepID=UPI000488DD51|nr:MULTISPECIES: hypothetical protein [unclassified Pseudomonas]SNB84568.1 hypothetical protein SAMN02745900_04452 [Pseudomonas sp. URIL14HWK12:I8]